jgi:superfamily II DNA/RNA helicase
MGIVNQLPRNRQTLLFSATMPPQIRQFSKQLLRSPYKEISLAISKPAENILQGVYEVEDEGKVKLVEYLLQNRKSLGRVIIFASTKAKVRELSTVLQKRGLDVGAVHSDLEQEERERQLAAFKSGKISVIVATDVLSRGIDIKGIDLVLNFDVPGDAEDYVHRIGRTARADASGVALTLVNSKDWYKFEKIETLIDMKIRRSPLPDFLTNAASKAPNKSFYKKRGPRRNRPTNSSN